MQKLAEYTLQPTPEKFLELKHSKLHQNRLGEAYVTWEPAVLMYHANDADWQHVTSEYDMTAIQAKHNANVVEVLGKLIPAPRSGLLHKAWGLFYATGEKKFLQLAFETMGNNRSTHSVKQTALKLYNEAVDFYGEHTKHEYPAVEVWAAAMGELYDSIMKSRQQLKELQNQGLMSRYMHERKELLDNQSLDSSNPPNSKLGESGDLENPEPDERAEKIREAEKIFDEIASTLLI